IQTPFSRSALKHCLQKTVRARYEGESRTVVRLVLRRFVMNQTTRKAARALKVAVASLALAGLAACASNFNANVSRFQSQMPAPQGQTFAVVAEDPALAGGLEFA